MQKMQLDIALFEEKKNNFFLRFRIVVQFRNLNAGQVHVVIAQGKDADSSGMYDGTIVHPLQFHALYSPNICRINE